MPHPVVGDNPDGSVTFQYKPLDRGIHEVALSYNDRTVDGSPFRCHVDAMGGGFVTAYGSGLIAGSIAEEACFTVVAGSKKAAVTIDGPGKPQLKKNDKGKGHSEYSFMPMQAGEYTIDIKVDGKHITGSPFSSKVSGGGESRKRSQLSIAATSEKVLGGTNVDLTNVVATLKSPSGKTEGCILKKTVEGALALASFAPREKGTYNIEVTKDGNKYPGSPFKINVGESDVANAGHVRVSGPGIKNATAQQQNEIQIDIAAGAGHGALAISVEGAHRSDMEYTGEAKGPYKVSYKPHEPGIYVVNIRFADEHVTGSPFLVNVGGKASGRVRETVTRNIKEADACHPGSKCQFQLKIPGTDPMDFEAFLTSPSGETECCEIMDLAEFLYDIKFVPKEKGVHTVSLKYKGLHISGSPFQYTVGPTPKQGAYKVEVGGPGVEKGEAGELNEFNIYTREAGGGDISVSVEGPSKAKIDLIDRGDGFATASYKVSKEGEYGVHIKYGNDHVPESPFMVYVAPQSGDAKKLTVHGLRDRGVEANKPCTFTVTYNGAHGTLKGHVDTPSGEMEDVFVQEMDPNNQYAVRFMPRENGVHFVTVKLDEAHIPGSPLPFLVGKHVADPALVLASGDGLEKGTVGKPSKFKVITGGAGHGVLHVGIEGPSKVVIICHEVPDGYEFSYTPKAPGDYMIHIKFSNITIAGSPTKAKVTGSGKPSSVTQVSSFSVETTEKKPGAAAKKFHGDASKVVAKGPGLQKTFINRSTQFTCDVAGAGNAMLSMGMLTSNGNPVEEMTFKRTRGTIFTGTYKTKEKGEHTLSIKWGADEIPGSPFAITVT